MKKRILTLLSVFAFLLVACGPGGGSSGISSGGGSSTGSSSKSSVEQSSQKTSSEKSSKEVSSEPSSQPKSSQVLDKYYEIKDSQVVDVFFPGDYMLFSSVSENVSYILLDDAGRVVYSVVYVYYGYGTRLKSYHSPMYESILSDLFSAGKVRVLEGMLGYEVNNDTYIELMKKMSDNKIAQADLEDPYSDAIVEWNSTNNKYINDKIGIIIKEDSVVDTRNDVPFRLSSVYDNFDAKGFAAYLMEAPYDDDYIITCDEGSINLVDEDDKPISPKSGNTYTFERGEKVIVKVNGSSMTMFNLKVKLVKHVVELPYEVSDNPGLDTYDTVGDKTKNPNVAQQLKVLKRDDGRGLYVNCNNPEALYDDCLNTVLTGQEVTDKEVFFTYEHNNKISTSYYYAYRVTNTGNKDIFITVKNMGNQLDGDGCWLGENEWTQFYNLSFRTKGLSSFTKSQRSNFDAYVGFCDTFEAEQRQPITYRVPKGKYIYVLGGTTLDAYKNINVFDTADKPISSNISGCSNGAVIFEVSGGKAFGQFMAYNSKDASSINGTPYITEHKQYGYATSVQTESGEVNVGHQYSGYDNCHGVIDTNLTFTFNDLTKAGALNVSYKNPYATSVLKGTPYSKITKLTEKTYSSATSWVTHINPASNYLGVGTDMTKYITTDHATGKDIIIEPESYDGLGETANIGNWMVDYIDTFTLVNQGDTDRTFTYSMIHNGVILAFVRDENGFVDAKAYPVSYLTKIAGSKYGDAINETFNYSVVVPAHSVVRFSVDYNLCANSNGYISHTCKLK